MPSQHRRLLLALTAVLVVLWIVLVVRGLGKAGVLIEKRPNDIWAYHVAARGVWERDLVPSYNDPERSNLYPPTFAILVSPLGLLGYRGAAVVWVLLSGALVVWIFRSMERSLTIPLSPVAKGAGLLLVLRMIDGDMANGNANIAVLALVLGALGLAARGRELWGGGLLAVAILAKVSPVIVLALGAYRLRWRFLLGAAIGLVLLGAVLPVAVLGPQGASEAWAHWYRNTLDHVDPASEAYSKAEGGGYEPGQSLRALVHRLLRPTDATSHDGEVVTIHLASLSKRTVDVVYLGLALAILAAVLLGLWRRAPGLRRAFRPEEIAAACALMVLLAPLSRKAHFVALWPAAVLGFEAWRHSDGRRLQRVGSGLWSLALVCVAATSPDIAGRAAATYFLGYCPFSLAALALLALVSWPGFFPRVIQLAKKV